MNLKTVARRGLNKIARLSGSGVAYLAPPAAEIDHAAVAMQRIAEGMVHRAAEAQRNKHYQKAALLLSEALELSPGNAALHVQCGHMFKEAGDLAAAEPHYMTAVELTPRDADLSLQLGHFYKCAGRLAKARLAYEWALALQPGWDAPADELKRLVETGWRGAGDDQVADGRAMSGFEPPEGQTVLATDTHDLTSVIAPRPFSEGFHAHGEGIELRSLELRERTFWGVLPTLKGVAAFRGICVSGRPVVTIEILLNEQLIYRGGLKGGYKLQNENENPHLRKYVFNVWIDLSGFVQGLYELKCRAKDVDNRSWSKTEQVVIAAPRTAPSVLPDSDALVPPPHPADPRSLDDQIMARPSMVRPGRRALFKAPPRTVLVQRPDALGDLVLSVPALRRLRELLPEARFIGVVSKANADFAATLDFFQEMIVIDLPFDPWERRRVMSVKDQQALAAQLARFDFDMAIDLNENGRSRVLLPLTGAPVLVGFRCDEIPNLTIDVNGETRDVGNGSMMVSHGNKALALIEWLGAMMRDEPTLQRRTGLDPDLLAAFGLDQGAGFVVLHAGGRWQFSRWPHYLELAQTILDRTDLRVILLTADTKLREDLPESLARCDRFEIVDRQLPFDELEALLSFCTVFTGDDSGVKHLASLRGAKVVSIQNPRNNWSEWGQESGYIITRKMPCAGCQIQNGPDSVECGRDFVCITAVKPDEVFAAMQALIANGDPVMAQA